LKFNPLFCRNSEYFMPTLDICLSPALFQYYDTDNKIIVVIDVIRATSTVCVAFIYGAAKIIPVETEAEALEYRNKGYLIAGERNGDKLEGYDFGNSPFDFMTPLIKGETLVMTTTNGTRAINVSKKSMEVATGAFINSDCLSDWLIKKDHDIIFLCSGWFFKVNVEDTLLAGKLCSRLIDTGRFYANSDAANIAISLFIDAKNDIYNYVIKNSPRLRNKQSVIGKDLQYCLSDIQLPVVPVLQENVLIPLFF